MFNGEGHDCETMAKADRTEAAKSGSLMLLGDDDGDAVEVMIDGSGAVSIDIGGDVGEGEELKVGVTRFGMDERMSEER